MFQFPRYADAGNVILTVMVEFIAISVELVTMEAGCMAVMLYGLWCIVPVAFFIMDVISIPEVDPVGSLRLYFSALFLSFMDTTAPG